MKIGVVSDTHIPERAEKLPQQLLRGLKGVDMIIHCGDLVELSVLDALHKVCPDVRAVAGNMDPSDVRGKLPEKLLIGASRFTIGVIHGYGPPQKVPEFAREAFRKDKVDLIVFGHSHQPGIIKGDPPLFNPGSPTDTLFTPYRSYGMIELDSTIKTEIIRLE